MHSRSYSMRSIDAGALISSREADSAPRGSTKIALSQSTASALSATESCCAPPMCRSAVRPAWEMVGLWIDSSVALATMVSLRRWETAGLRRAQGTRCDRSVYMYKALCLVRAVTIVEEMTQERV